jgi:hypothetical protein
VFAAALHTAMRFWLFSVPTKSIGTMRLFDLVDLPFLIAFRPRVWFANAALLHRFQHNLNERKWASLAEIYPRSMMWGYAYQLFFWGRYCNALAEILSYPDKCLLAEVFLRYICQIDVYIDSCNSQVILQSTPHFVKNRPLVRAVAAEFCRRLWSLNVPRQDKESIARLVVEYRRDALTISQRWAEASSGGLTSVIEYKEQTVGKLMYNWSRILGHLYQLPGDLAENISEVFFNFAMALQFVDDLSDVGPDHQVNTQNLFLGIVKEDPLEWDTLRAYLGQSADPFMRWPWAKKNVPRSYLKARELHKAYIRAMQNNSRRPELTSELGVILNRLEMLAGCDPLSSG